MSFLRPSCHFTLLVRWRWDTFHRHLVSHHPFRTMRKPMLDGVPLVSRDGVSCHSVSTGMMAFWGCYQPLVLRQCWRCSFPSLSPVGRRQDCESIQTDSSKGHLYTKKMRLWAVFCKRKSQNQQINVSEGHLS